MKVRARACRCAVSVIGPRQCTPAGNSSADSTRRHCDPWPEIRGSCTAGIRAAKPGHHHPDQSVAGIRCDWPGPVSACTPTSATARRADRDGVRACLHVGAWVTSWILDSLRPEYHRSLRCRSPACAVADDAACDRSPVQRTILRPTFPVAFPFVNADHDGHPSSPIFLAAVLIVVNWTFLLAALALSGLKAAESA